VFVSGIPDTKDSSLKDSCFQFIIHRVFIIESVENMNRSSASYKPNRRLSFLFQP